VNTPLGYVSLVVAPLVLLVASEMFSWARSRGDSDSDDTDDEDSDPVPKPAIRHINEVRAELDAPEKNEHGDESTTDSGDNREAVTVAVADLKLTILAMGGLVGYAAWNVYREVSTVAAPDPISVGALTGGLLGLGFAVWVTVTARLANADAKTDRPSRTPPARADGGTEVEQ
jgi:signal peptidase